MQGTGKRGGRRNSWDVKTNEEKTTDAEQYYAKGVLRSVSNTWLIQVIKLTFAFTHGPFFDLKPEDLVLICIIQNGFRILTFNQSRKTS